MRHSCSSLCLSMVLGFSSAMHVTHAASLSFMPEAQTVSPGSSFTVDLRAFDLPAETVGGSVDIFYTPSLLCLDAVTVDSTVWEFDTRSGDIDNSNGKLSLLSFTSFAGRSGNVDIATLTFTAKDSGTSTLGLTQNALNPFTLADGSVFNPSLIGGSVTVSAVPIPAPVALFMSGALAMLVSGRRRCFSL